MNHVRLWTLKNKGQGRKLVEPGGGYYRGHGLHGALGVVKK